MENTEEESSKENTEQVVINVSDIKHILNMIEVISRRGGFSPKEFVAVGNIYEKMCNYCKN